MLGCDSGRRWVGQGCVVGSRYWGKNEASHSWTHEHVNTHDWWGYQEVTRSWRGHNEVMTPCCRYEVQHVPLWARGVRAVAPDNLHHVVGSQI